MILLSPDLIIVVNLNTKVAGIDLSSDMTFFVHKTNMAVPQRIKLEFLEDGGFQSLPNIV